jgi:hypothetical protein
MMRRNTFLVLLAMCPLPLACTYEDNAKYTTVTFEPAKTQALYRGVSGVWEARLSDGVARLELCEHTPRGGEENSTSSLMRSAETVPREVVLNTEQPGGGGCGVFVPGTSAEADWRGTWSTESDTVEARATFRSEENPYPEVYEIYIVLNGGSFVGSKLTGLRAWHRLDGTFRATTYFGVSERDSDVEFRKVGEANCEMADEKGAP